jgi:AraC-like DNA-binding protein
VGFFPPQVPHSETWFDKSTPYRLAWWVIQGDGPLFQFTQYSKSRGFRLVASLQISRVGQDASTRCKRLVRYVQQKTPPSLDELKEAMLTLTLFIMRTVLADAEPKRVASGDDIVQKAKRFIGQNLARPLSVSEVANAVHLSPNYLISLFREHAGFSLGSYIKQQRIGAAKQLLSKPELSIKEIALDLGFEDPYTFSRTFKRVEGISPLHYRQSFL